MLISFCSFVSGIVLMASPSIADGGLCIDNSDPLYTLPCLRPIVPVASCITINPNGSFSVSWGYNNLNKSCCPAQYSPIVDNAARAGNFFSPAPIDRGQPLQSREISPGNFQPVMVFEPGIHTNVFTTTWDGSPLTWKIRTFIIKHVLDAIFHGYEVQSATVSASSIPDLCPVYDCAGNLFGDMVVDQCGLCGGNGTSCLDCAGVPNGTSVVDQCGVCGGNGQSCVDCAGTPFGSAGIDRCGVCGGNGQSCSDCNGTAFGTAVADRCGVCAGDGQSCLNCTDKDILNSLLSIDSNADAQRHVVRRAVKAITASSRATAADRRAAKRAYEDADALYLQNWRLTWSLPRLSTNCANAIFCATQDNSPTLNTYKANALTLSRTARGLAPRLSRLNPREARRARSNADKQYKIAIAAVSGIPAQQSVCS